MLRTPVRIVPQRADNIVKQVVAASAKGLACAETETSPSVVGRLPGSMLNRSGSVFWMKLASLAAVSSLRAVFDFPASRTC